MTGERDVWTMPVDGRDKPPTRNRDKRQMTPDLLTVLAIGTTLDVAIIGLIFKVMVDVGSLRERMARIEGLFEGFTGRKPVET